MSKRLLGGIIGFKYNTSSVDDPTGVEVPVCTFICGLAYDCPGLLFAVSHIERISCLPEKMVGSGW